MCGPAFLVQDVSCWPIKETCKKEGLEGELRIPRGVYAVVGDLGAHVINRILHRSSSEESCEGLGMDTVCH